MNEEERGREREERERNEREGKNRGRGALEARVFFEKKGNQPICETLRSHSLLCFDCILLF